MKGCFYFFILSSPFLLLTIENVDSLCNSTIDERSALSVPLNCKPRILSSLTIKNGMYRK